MNEKDNFHTISKTANIIGVQAHVLRFWEKKFFMIKPKKSSSGRRYYSSLDIKYLLIINQKVIKLDHFVTGLRHLNVFGRCHNPDGAYTVVISKWFFAAINHVIIYQ